MKIDFYLRFHTKYQQTLWISGNIQQLGNNDDDIALPMIYLNNDYWHASIEINAAAIEEIRYHYLLRFENGDMVADWEKNRSIEFLKDAEIISVIDTWNFAGEYENAFFTDPFQKTWLAQNETKLKIKAEKKYTHIFKVKAPLLKKNEVVCLTGAGNALGGWQADKPVLMKKEDDWWTAKITLLGNQQPVVYKYGVYNIKDEKFVRYEDGDNRSIPGDLAHQITIVHDGFVHLPNNIWKGAGVAIPVFSLRSKKSFGVGEFTDLRLMIDWAKAAGLKMIQLLPVNDTTATHTQADSYPYAAISAFALHPLYINLEKAAGKKNDAVIKSLKKKQKQLNELPDVAYAEVMKFKYDVLRELYQLQGKDDFNSSEYNEFFDDNKHWLKPYAAFCFFRDKYGTSDFNSWKTNSVYNEAEIEKLFNSKSKLYSDVALYLFIQFHLHLQLKDIADYARRHGIVLKGDIPIGVYRYGCDAWMAPALFNMDMQAGAPPDDFAVKGQNWGFPTYNWQRMQQDGFAWWRQRFTQMSRYFSAFRIDHILGFFRIWSVPMHAVEGILGHFVPAIPIHINEFKQKNIWFDYRRYCLPYITDQIAGELFGDLYEKVRNEFLIKNDAGTYDLEMGFQTQRQAEDYFAAQEQSEENARIKNGLFNLISNVILLEKENSQGEEFHFRISMESTSSFKNLDWHLQQQLKELYVDYFYRRQDEFWKHEAMQKLPHLKEATNMLICGEDLGMVPHSVPEVMRQLGILSLEIQRMPKDTKTEFFHPNNALYLSVITPSTHDMSTIRGWWEEDRSKTQRFYNAVLQQNGDAPFFCEPWINRTILLQHLYSPAILCVFLLQDILGMDGKLRRQNPQEERINIPADPKHFWKYRMHITLEDLLKEKSLINELRTYIENSGR